jgi:O-antigen/teichoic acid export membrane protein
MSDLRRAVLFASGGRYVVTGINLAAAIVLARLLTPAEFGISVIGTSILGIAEAIRELGSIAYLVQQKEIPRGKIRTVFTISLLVTLAMTAMLILLSEPFARFFDAPPLAQYIRIVALSYCIAPFVHPIYAMLSRDMAFDKLAMLDAATALVSALSSIGFVLLGFSYTGLAWAAVVAGATWTLLGSCVLRDFSIYVPSLTAWRSVLMFGAFGSATAVLYRVSEALFFLFVGKVVDARAVGLFQRAGMLAQFPERVILAGIAAVALPAFSKRARQGDELKSTYLGAVEYVTAVQWPLLVMLVIMAGPIVHLLYGAQWDDAVPLIRILSLALFCNFPTSLNYPIQVAAGAIRHTVPLAFVQSALLLFAVFVTAHYGIEAIALGVFLVVPVNVSLSILVVRAHAPFAWREFAGALTKSLGVTCVSGIGPLVVVAVAAGMSTPISITSFAIAVGIFASGWIVGLWLTRHPLFLEVRRVARMAANFGFAWVGNMPGRAGGGS